MKILLYILDLLQGFNPISAAVRLLLAAIAGGFIGRERGKHGRAAGLRTHMLVCLGSAMTALVGLYVSQVLQTDGDPMRISAQVISGIGFLGAGTILTRRQSQITGLTTAAGLWTTASLGLLIAVGFYWAAAVGFVITLLIMTLLTKLESKVKKHEVLYYLELHGTQYVDALYEKMRSKFKHMTLTTPQSGVQGNVGVECTVEEDCDVQALAEEIRAYEGVAFFIPQGVDCT